MKKTILLIAILFISLVNFAQQDTTITFINDTIPSIIVVDSIIYSSDFIIIDTIDLQGKQFSQDVDLKPWFVRDSVYINVQKFAKRHVQRKYERYDGTKVIRSYRYEDIRYIRQPGTIKIKAVVN